MEIIWRKYQDIRVDTGANDFLLDKEQNIIYSILKMLIHFKDHFIAYVNYVEI